jgi:hypothetical protein
MTAQLVAKWKELTTIIRTKLKVERTVLQGFRVEFMEFNESWVKVADK